MDLPDFLTRDTTGDICLTGHRIGLEDVAFYYEQGYSPEMLWETFPTLALSHIHKTIGFYLDHRQEVAAYVEQRGVESQRLKASLPKGPSLAELRDRLQAKRSIEAGRNAAGLPS
jgi:uncharacterized protein (DUF433 family)